VNRKFDHISSESLKLWSLPRALAGEVQIDIFAAIFFQGRIAQLLTHSKNERLHVDVFWCAKDFYTHNQIQPVLIRFPVSLRPYEARYSKPEVLGNRGRHSSGGG